MVKCSDILLVKFKKFIADGGSDFVLLKFFAYGPYYHGFSDAGI